MPQYSYKCQSCDKEWEEVHSINEQPTQCPFCEMSNFKRIPALVSFIRKMDEQNKVRTGEIVKEYIEQNKQVLREIKQELKSKEA